MSEATDLKDSVVAQQNDVLDQAQAFIEGLAQYLHMDLPDIGNLPTVDYSAAVANLYNLFQIQVPTVPNQSVNVSQPTAPDLTFSPIDTVTTPEFAITPPSVDIPAAVPFTLPTAPAQPTVADIALPVAPSVTLPTLPTLNPIVLPEVPAIDIPSFTSSLPEEDFLTPSNNFAFAEQAYASALLDEAQAKLLADMQNGSYGIEPLDELNLWSRARDREIDVTLMEIEETYRAAGARGFPLPPDDTALGVERALQRQQEKLASISREIAIKRGELYAETRKFTLGEVRALENILINFHNAVQERSLNAAKATLQAAISIYETQLKRFQARLDAYKTDAQVFEAKVRAASQQIEIYARQIQAAQVSAEIQRTQIETYNAQVRGVELVVQIYRTQMEAANVAANVQRTKIEAFQALIQAYSAQVQAEVSKQQAYEARIKGELAKVSVYEAQVRAYTAQIEGLKSRASIIIERARAEWEQARVKIEKYKGQLEGTDISLRSQLGIVNANIQTYQERTRIYTAQLQALASQFELDEQAIRNSREIQVKQADIQIATSKLLLDRAIQTLTLQKDGFQIAGSYFNNSLAAIMGAVQAIASVSATG